MDNTITIDAEPKGFELQNSKTILSGNYKMEKIVMESVYGIEQTKDVVIALASLSNTIVTSMANGGKIGIEILPGLLLSVPKILTAVSGAVEIPKELSDLQDEEQHELVQCVKDELNIDEKAELIVSKSLDILFEVKKLIDLFGPEKV